MKIILFCLFMSLASFCIAEEKGEELSNKEIFEALFEKQTIQRTVVIDPKEQIVLALKKEFSFTDEDIAFIFSVREARLPIDGFDFLRNPKELLQLASLCAEARKEWGAPVISQKEIGIPEGEGLVRKITTDFYGFFPVYCEKRIMTGGSGKHWKHWADFYQTEQARKRFVAP